MVSFSSIKHFNQSSAEQKIRNATNNDPFGPLGGQLNELATLTFHSEKLRIIQQIISKRLSIKSPHKNWRVILKTMTVIVYLLQSGAREFVTWCKSNFTRYSDRFHRFKCYDMNQNEIGEPIRSKIKLINKLITDDSELDSLRTKFHELRNEMSIPGLKMFESPRNSVSTIADFGDRNSPHRKTRSLDFSSTTAYNNLNDDLPGSPVKSRLHLDTLAEEDATYDLNENTETHFPVYSYGNSPIVVESNNPFFKYIDTRTISNKQSSFAEVIEKSNNPFIDIHT